MPWRANIAATVFTIMWQSRLKKQLMITGSSEYWSWTGIFITVKLPSKCFTTTRGKHAGFHNYFSAKRLTFSDFYLNNFRVLYFSIHGYQNGAFWPHLRETDYHYIGRGAGRGYNVNVPMNKIKMGNNDYMAIFQQLLLPIAYEVTCFPKSCLWGSTLVWWLFLFQYNPELVIVSAGYDAALGCPEV